MSTKLELPEPPAGLWLRRRGRCAQLDFDRHGHVSNAIHWQAVEHALAAGGIDPAVPLVAELDYREPIDPGDEVELVSSEDDGTLLISLRASGALRAVARVRAR